MEKIPVYDIQINKDNDDETGVNLVSFVSFPAIERDFVALSAPESAHVCLNEDKQILTGAALVPDMEILRIAGDGSPYFIKFSRATIEAIRDKFHRLKKTDQTNDEHENPLNGNFLVESWIITDPQNDKAAALGFSDLPAGTWVLSFKVPDSEYWAEFIKSGVRSGFSIEGLFNLDLVESELKKQTSNKMTVAEKFFDMVQKFFATNPKASEEIKFEGEPCEDCPNKEDGEKLGTNGGQWLSDRIDEMVTDEMSRGDIIANVATAAGVDESTINQIISGEIDCPPLERLQAFAEVMDVTIETVVAQFREDGCSYSEDEEANEETPEEAAEVTTPIEQAEEKTAEDWDKLEAAAADVEKLKAEHAEKMAAMQKTIDELTAQVAELSAAPAVKPIETAPAPEKKMDKYTAMVANLKKAKSGK